MIGTCRRLLALLLVAFILLGSIQMPMGSGNVNAAMMESEELTSEKAAESTDQKDTQEEKKENQEKEQKEEETSTEESPDQDISDGEDTQEEKKEAEESSTEEVSTEKDAGEETTTEAAEEATSEASTQEVTPETDEDDLLIFEDYENNLYSTLGPHDLDMPDVTSHYFTLQKNSQKVSAASGSNLKVVKDANEASNYIYNEMSQGKEYSFIPQFTSSTVVGIGGGSNGGVSLSTVKASNHDEFGEIYDLAKKNRVSTMAFNLSKCTSNPFAIYTNVGTWYNPSNKYTYSVDMKLEVTGVLFPSETIRKQLNNPYKAPYVAFANDSIGVIAMGTDYVQTQMTFYYHGTEEKIWGLHGVIQFCDIDCQQGVDFGDGFEKIVMFNVSGSHLQYTSSGLIGHSIGYVSSRVVDDLNSKDSKTTALGVFSGPSVTCRWTVAKCDHEDTGGKAAYGASKGYGIPADSSQKDAISYHYSNSTGFLGILTHIGLIPITETVTKNVYDGGFDASKSRSQARESKLTDRTGKATFVLTCAAASPSEITKAQYVTFTLEDYLEALFEIDGDVRIFTEEFMGSASLIEATSFFNISHSEGGDHRTYLKIEGKESAMKSSDFYGRTYFVHVPVRIRSEKELQARGLSILNWCQSNNELGESISSGISYTGVVAAENSAQLYVVSNQWISATLSTGPSIVRIPVRAIVRKFGDENNTPVAGVVFGFFGGKASDYKSSDQPFLTATTDADGFAYFESDTFYQKEYGNGPYHIREISVPDLYKNVWYPSIDEAWSYDISDFSSVEFYDKKEDVKEIISKDKGDNVVWNTPYVNPEKKVRVYKESTDTKEKLEDAVFGLYEWSQSKQEYVKLMNLTAGFDGKKVPCYYNEKSFSNTMDNLGKYKVVEEKAPKGCTLSKEEWTFDSNHDDEELVKTFENDLQKAKIVLEKKGEDEKVLEGVKFRVKADEDIYAPWVKEESDKNKDNLLVAKGTILDTLTTDENGQAKSTKGHELYIGHYVVEEIEGAVGYVCDPTPIPVDLKYSDDDKEKVIEYSLNVTNEPMKPAMAVSKLADRTKNELNQQVQWNSTTGRYVDPKVAGTYQEKEWVDYTISVTNTGNVDLVNLTLLDTMDHINEDQTDCLKDYVEKNSAHFEIPKEGYYVSGKGDKIQASSKETENDGITLNLDHLMKGDTVAVHFKIQVKEGAANAFNLRNDVVLSASYVDKEGEGVEGEVKTVPTDKLVDEDGNSLVKDSDHIHIPGSVEPCVAKLANHTTGAVLKEGRYEGKKMEGTYEYGETVDFTITVTNHGTADLYQILVEDTLDEKLRNALQEDSVVFEEGTYRTSMGEETHAMKKEEKEPGKYSLLLDYLTAGDSVELHLKANVKTGIDAETALKNKVVISAEYQTGKEKFESVPRTPSMEDDDTIGIAVPNVCIAKKADKTSGVQLKEGRYDGTRKQGLYKAGEKIYYTITVTNQGTGRAKDITVIENESEKLLKYVSMSGFSYKKDESLTTTKGNTIMVLSGGSRQVVLSELLPGDSVDLIYEGKVKADIVTVNHLENTVEVSGKNSDGSPIPKTDKMKDQDNIRLKKEGKASNTSSHISSVPKTGDDSQWMGYAVLATSALVGATYCFRRRKVKS